MTRKLLLVLIVAALIVGVGYSYWPEIRAMVTGENENAALASSNGRIEAVEIDIASKTAGRLQDVYVREGDYVAAGEKLAKMDTATLEAQLREAEAQLRSAEIGIETANSQVTQRQAEKEAAEATVAQQEATLEAAEKRLTRSQTLQERGTGSVQQYDDDKAAFEGAKAALAAAKAKVAAADAALGYARSGVVTAEAQVDAMRATVERIKTDLDDSTLTSPRIGRVQYRIAEPGEVVNAGSAILNLVDLSDVYMTFFLPTLQAGRVALGAEARIVLDAAPQYVIPATISYVADVAQFTPKTVETAEERQKLMFRIKAQIPTDLLKEHIRYVKTGLPGMAYVKIDGSAEWPDNLKVNLPQKGAPEPEPGGAMTGAE
ncbi:HlyD family secretion protein [Afifella sp. H1R]|uniref:HlyD family secretion protein n=1 Tax=unclassified Afifella TaxID=2624128 RepID=UPI001F37E939|nr:HlyD family efflux transporter periplasmic adaptor subunit [Afifella sp. H1R]MCF1503862.1 HlyD family efflux transporter periplasmic adaptor subunit [Afifella sp. H1R]